MIRINSHACRTKSSEEWILDQTDALGLEMFFETIQNAFPEIHRQSEIPENHSFQNDDKSGALSILEPPVQYKFKTCT